MNKARLIIPAVTGSVFLGLGALTGHVLRQPASPAAPQRYLPVAAAARAYLRAHPVPARPGMDAGIVTSPVTQWRWQCRPGQGTRGQGCMVWPAQLMLPGGRTVTFTCGTATTTAPPATWHPCTDTAYVPEPGDYVYIPAGLKVSGTAAIQVIRRTAVTVWSCPPDAGRSCPWEQGVPVH